MTPLQHRCLDTISSYITEKGYSPSYGDIADGLGCGRIKAFELVAALIRQGRLLRTADRTRNLRLPGFDLSRVSTEALRAELERRGV